MARRIDWVVSNFRAGLHSEPSRVQAGDVYAADWKNLRVDKDGRLVQRYPIETIDTNFSLTNTIQGLATARRGEDVVIMYLLSTGAVRLRVVGGTDQNIVTNSGFFAGKVSLQFAEKDVLVFTTEGTDDGYWIDMQDYAPPSTPTVNEYELGIERPPTGMNVATSAGSGPADGFYYYVNTFERHIDDLVDADPLKGTDTVPYESHHSQIFEVQVAAPNSQVDITLLPTPTDPQVTRKNVYRTLVQAASVPTYDRAELTFYRVNDTTIATGTPGWTDDKTDAQISDATNSWYRVLRKDNQKLPASVRTLANYNGRLWGASRTELRPSDIRSGVSTWWAFPDADALRFNTELTFTATYRDMLLFGGPSGIWRLIGVPPDYDIQQISTIGPVNPYAWTIARIEPIEVFTFIGISGIYICDGSSVAPIHEPLNEFFPNTAQVKDASVVHLPSEETLYTVSLNPQTGDDVVYNFLRQKDGTWQKWEGINILQGVVIETTDANDEKSYDVWIAENGENEIREIVWDREGITFDTTFEFQSGQGGVAIDWFWKSQEIDWSDQRLQDEFKTFRWLEVTVSSDLVATVDVWVDGTQVITAQSAIFRAGLPRPGRSPIMKRGRKIQVQLSGTTPPSAAIESIGVVGTVA